SSIIISDTDSLSGKRQVRSRMKRVGSRHRNAITSRVLSIDACYMILGYSNLAVNLFIAGISLGPEKALMPEFVPMDIATAKSFLAQHHYGVLATRRKDGNPQMSPITPGLDGDGRVIISSREPAFKVENTRRDP